MLIIMRGVPGSGKSTLAKSLSDNLKAPIYSTDEYWIRPDGYYDFNFKRISEAHAWNLNSFNENVSMCDSALEKFYAFIIDNTNITYEQFKPYISAYTSHGFSIVSLEEPETSWRFNAEECFKRNTHNVPLASIENMIKKYESNESIALKIAADFPSVKLVYRSSNQ